MCSSMMDKGKAAADRGDLMVEGGGQILGRGTKCSSARALSWTYCALSITTIVATFLLPCCCAQDARLGPDRLVLQTAYGDIHLAFYPEIAPQTVKNIRRLAALGAYTTNHFFRVDAGFVAQVADVRGGRSARMDDVQEEAASRTVPLEVHTDIKHDRRGLLSMARHSDPNSGQSSFSILLGPAPHLDMQYTIFGEVTKGLEVLSTFEKMPTKREGIFVMPESRIEIVSTYM